MTIEELKNTLMTETEDKAGMIDSVVGAFSDISSQLEEATRNIEEMSQKNAELSDKLNSLTETNLKLLDKIKYEDEAGSRENEDDHEPEVEFEDLTTIYEED